MNLSELQELHKKHVITPWLPQGGFIAPVIVRGEGSYLIDEKGTKYLDLGSGRVAVNLGHGHPKVVQAIQEQAATLCYVSPGFFNDKRAQLGA
jgi:taurine---2-oxoglutarate transaminase